MEPKLIQNGTKIVPNGTQNEAKLEHVLNPNPAEITTKSNEASIKISNPNPDKRKQNRPKHR